TFRRGYETQRRRDARWLVYAWLGQNVLLSVSASWRLWLFVAAENLTRLRLATAIWLGLVAFGLVTIVWRIVSNRDNAWLLRLNTLATIVVLYVCCFPNLDGFIADYNADHCLNVRADHSPVGLPYLRDLGDEALPALGRLSRTLPNKA